MKYSVNALTLKWIAIVTMFIDHAGYVCYKWLGWSETYLLMRHIGRIAFPIFVLLLLEGFRYTRNRWAYLRNLFIFALISEVSFDLALTGWDVRMNMQNIFFTLCLGLLNIMLLDGLREWGKAKRPPVRYLAYPCMIFSVVALLAAAEIIRVDYKAWGVLIVVLIYAGEECVPRLTAERMTPQLARNVGAVIGIALWMALYDSANGWLNECYGIFAVIPILLYDGTRGQYRLSKWFFYGFYPVHLLILYLCRDTLFRWLLT